MIYGQNNMKKNCLRIMGIVRTSLGLRHFQHMNYENLDSRAIEGKDELLISLIATYLEVYTWDGRGWLESLD